MLVLISINKQFSSSIHYESKYLSKHKLGSCIQNSTHRKVYTSDDIVKDEDKIKLGATAAESLIDNAAASESLIGNTKAAESLNDNATAAESLIDNAAATVNKKEPNYKSIFDCSFESKPFYTIV